MPKNPFEINRKGKFIQQRNDKKSYDFKKNSIRKS